MCFPSGIFMFNIINDHTASSVLYMSAIEIILVMYIYGIKNFLSNIAEMKIWMPVVLNCSPCGSMAPCGRALNSVVPAAWAAAPSR